MNLIAKRLYSSSIGDNVQITLKDGLNYEGIIKEKDEECIAISDGQSEVIVTYEDVRSVKVLVSSESPALTPVNAMNNTIQNVSHNSRADIHKKENTIDVPVHKHKLNFITTVSNRKIPDLLINQAFRELPKYEKKILNGNFSSFMSAIKNNDISTIMF